MTNETHQPKIIDIDGWHQWLCDCGWKSKIGTKVNAGTEWAAHFFEVNRG